MGEVIPGQDAPSESGHGALPMPPADIRKAYQQGDVNAATGVAWTQPDTLAALEARGYSPTEAQSYLNIPYKG